jgi:hypothetical protein
MCFSSRSLPLKTLRGIRSGCSKEVKKRSALRMAGGKAEWFQGLTASGYGSKCSGLVDG